MITVQRIETVDYDENEDFSDKAEWVVYDHRTSEVLATFRYPEHATLCAEVLGSK